VKRNHYGAMAGQRLQRLQYEAEAGARSCANPLELSSHTAYFIGQARSVYPHAVLPPPGILQRAAPPSGKEYSRDGAEDQGW
jgi:hypothetical protein